LRVGRERFLGCDDSRAVAVRSNAETLHGVLPFAVNNRVMRETVCTLRVRFGETDAFGIVFYPTFFSYFDVAVTAMLRASPYDFARGIREGGFGFPIVEAGARFLAPLAADDEFDIATRVTEVRERSFRIEHTVRRDATVIASGFEVRAYSSFSRDERRIVVAVLPSELSAWLRANDDAIHERT
jgi:acyl-CoA thioester hydrolase